jgi:hypothetical protein
MSGSEVCKCKQNENIKSFMKPQNNKEGDLVIYSLLLFFLINGVGLWVLPLTGVL